MPDICNQEIFNWQVNVQTTFALSGWLSFYKTNMNKSSENTKLKKKLKSLSQTIEEFFSEGTI